MLREILDIELNQLLLSENHVPDNRIERGARQPDDSEAVDSNSTKIAPPAEENVAEASGMNVHKSIKVDHDVNAEQKAKSLYKSCMNAEILEQRNLEPLHRLLRALGGWPVLDGDKWDASKFDWLELAAKLRLYNNDVLINQWVGLQMGPLTTLILHC